MGKPQGEIAVSSKKSQKSLAGFPQRLLVALLVTNFTLVALLYLSPTKDVLHDRVTYPLAFQARSRLGRNPQIDQRLKIITFDDLTIGYLKRAELQAGEWADLIEALAAAKVDTVVIDKIFGLPFPDDDDLARLKKALKSGPKTIAAAFVAEAPVAARAPLPLEPQAYSLSALLDQGLDERPAWLGQPGGHAYGPDASLFDSFHRVGHINRLEHSYVRPLMLISPEKVVPHATLFIGGDPAIVRQGIKTPGGLVPTDASGRLLVNLSPVDDYRSIVISMTKIIDDIVAKRPLRGIEPGDTVIILPSMFTGGADFKDTYLGPMPGGMVVAAMANSALSGQWIAYWDAGLIGFFFAALLGCLSGLLLRATTYAAVQGTVLLGACITGVSAFVFYSLMLEWLFPALAFGLSGFAVFIAKTRRAERETRRLREALEGVLPPKRLKAILENPRAFDLKPSEQLLTLMFVDIAGFSAACESLTPRESFRVLKNLLNDLSQTVHEFDGIVDRTIGDGLLCYFGYQYSSDTDARMQVDQALGCAIKIQQDNLRRCVEESGDGQPVFPLRIGINTAGVFIGDLGDERRLDFTVIGNGVNFAQRLEASCENFHVMLGATSFGLLTSYRQNHPQLRRRLIAVKHHKETIEAFEFDPFPDEKELLGKAIDAYRRYAKIERKQERWLLDSQKLMVETSQGPGQIVNFSHSGFALRLPVYLAKGLQLKVESIGLTDAEGQGRDDILKNLSLPKLLVETRWGGSAAGEFVHGVLIKNLSDEQLDLLFGFLKNHVCTSREQGTRTA